MKPLPSGSVVICRYRDHVLFKDSDASQYQPWTREAVGWLDFENEDYVRLVWERFCEPNSHDNGRTSSTGLSILRVSILEMRKIG
jgi:hypothetical protein